jgi:glutathione S-transferase
VAVNPNSKIPALLDRSGPKSIRVFESGSILLYLAEKFGAFLPNDFAVRTETLNWLFWQVGSAPYLGGGFGHFYAYAPTKIEYAIDRFAGNRHNWARLIVMVDREKLPDIGSFADVREIARAQVRAWQRERFDEAYLVGGEHASLADLAHRVGDALGERTPRRATPAWVLMTFARLADAWSRVTGRSPM